MTSDDGGLAGTQQGWLAGGTVTVFLFLAGLFIKEQTDISSINQRESDHAEAINAQVALIRIDLQNLVGTRERIDDAVSRRMNDNVDSLSKRIDIVNDRLTEIQRQTSAIEGKIGDSMPNLSPKRP